MQPPQTEKNTLPEDIARQKQKTPDMGPLTENITQIVLAGYGIEFYNVGTGKQLSFFMSCDTKENIWRTFYLPGIHGENGEKRESCAIEGKPIIMDDGTIYIGAGGGVINRLEPNGKDSYAHSFWIMNGSADAGKTAHDQANKDNPILIALNNERSTSMPEIYSPEYGGKPILYDSAPKRAVDYIVRAGWISEQASIDELENEWDTSTRYGPPGAAVMEHLSTGGDYDTPLEGNVAYPYRNKTMIGCATEKDGCMKTLVKPLWNRYAKNIKTEARAFDLCDRLHPNLPGMWGLEQGSSTEIKIKTELKPFMKTNITKVPDSPEKLYVSMCGNIYELDHNTKTLSHKGQGHRDGREDYDTTGIVAIDDHTLIIGSMGGPADNGTTLPTLQVLQKRDDGLFYPDAKQTESLIGSVKDITWKGERAPRVKSMAGTRTCSVIESNNECFTLLVRTKHTGNDLVRIVMKKTEEGAYAVIEVKPVSLTSQYNQEYFTMTEKMMITSPEAEDVVRRSTLYNFGKIEQAHADQVHLYYVGNGVESVQDQVATCYKEAPDFLRYGLRGTSGIAVSLGKIS